MKAPVPERYVPGSEIGSTTAAAEKHQLERLNLPTGSNAVPVLGANQMAQVSRWSSAVQSFDLRPIAQATDGI